MRGVCQELVLQPYPFARTVLLRGSSPKPYPPDIVKKDVVWLSPRIVVNQPVQSFGGDIIFYADEIVLNAPIDSRVYFDHSVDRFQEKAYFSAELRRPSTFNKMYADYYQTGSELSGNTRVSRMLPQLPDGYTNLPSFTGFEQAQDISPVDGAPPDDAAVDRTQTRSGTIYMFARKITVGVNAQYLRTIADEGDCTGTFQHLGKLILVTAAGARGGKGGAGSPAACFNPVGNIDGNGYGAIMARNMYPINCNQDRNKGVWLRNGGISGPGGDGGDAGSVYIYIVNNAVQLASIKDQLAKIVDVAGGRPGPTSKYQVPSAAGVTRVSESRCSMVRLGDYPAAKMGSAGELVVKETTPGHALTAVAALMRSKANRADYDLAGLSDEAKHGIKTTLSPPDDLHDFLAAAINQAELAILRDVKSATQGKPSPNSGYRLGVLDGQLSSTSLYALLDSNSRAPVRTLDTLAFSAVPKTVLSPLRDLLNRYGLQRSPPDRLNSYLQANNGLLNSPMTDPVSQLNAKQLISLVAGSNQQLAEIRTELLNIRDLLYHQLAFTRQQEVFARLSTLKQQLAVAQAEAQKQNDPWHAVGLLVKAGSAVAGITGALSDMANAKETQEFQKHGAEFSTGADAVGGAIAQLVNAPDPGKPIPSLLAQIDTATEEYASLVDEIARTEKQILDAKNQQITNTLRLRATVRDRYINLRTFMFLDFLKASIISYLRDPARSIIALHNNLDALETLLTRFPEQEPHFGQFPMPVSCTERSQMGCTLFGKDAHVRIIEGDVPIPNGAVRWPIYVIAPNTEAIVPTYGLSLITWK
jgi:hypothetical protein